MTREPFRGELQANLREAEEALARIEALADEWEHDKLHGLRYAARQLHAIFREPTP